MVKTTVYLPAELKKALARVAAEQRRSEADLLREAVASLTAATSAPAPRLPLFRSKGQSIANDIDKALAGLRVGNRRGPSLVFAHHVGTSFQPGKGPISSL